jgi:DNA invertase Pin-like site-specific DNA recombinase
LVNLLAEMEAVGVALVSFSDNLDLSTPQGRLMFQIIGAMAEFERSLICERVKAGIAHRKAQGKKFGGRTAKRLDMAEVTRMREGGASMAEIAKALNVSAGTIHSRLNAARTAAA